MTDPKSCRDCGSLTVSSGREQLCFSCQIKRSTAQREAGEDFFFDEEDPRTVHDGLEERLATALESIEIERELGRGGMGIVFRGLQTRLGRRVAVKVLPPHPDQDVGFAERFLQEARAMARLTHPNIVTIHDFGQTACGLHYIVMEYVDGRPLSALLAEGALTPTRFLDVIAQVSDALAYAHGQNVVHRDMKPENILVDGRDVAKIADFGIAKLEGERHVARLTKTHQILGTPLYMAPEQAQAAATVDHRADLYAIGVMLYEGLTGKFPGRSIEAPTRAAQVDRKVDPLVLGLLERDPTRRSGSAIEVAHRCRDLARNWKPQRRGGFLGRMFGS
ncbi:MAG: serine/threonine protein kinase [Planctomycetes bacterium]|nr:serine/threonine protein kinase [Planctomycetota bacterium]